MSSCESKVASMGIKFVQKKMEQVEFLNLCMKYISVLLPAKGAPGLEKHWVSSSHSSLHLESNAAAFTYFGQFASALNLSNITVIKVNTRWLEG